MWRPSLGSSMIVAVFLFFSYCAVYTGKFTLANVVDDINIVTDNNNGLIDGINVLSMLSVL